MKYRNNEIKYYGISNNLVNKNKKRKFDRKNCMRKVILNKKSARKKCTVNIKSHELNSSNKL